MKVQNSITVAQLDDDELKKIMGEWQKMKFDFPKQAKNFELHNAFPNMYDFMEALWIQSQNRSHVTDRKINTY